MSEWDRLCRQYDQPPLGQTRTMIIKRMREEGDRLQEKLEETQYEWSKDILSIHELGKNLVAIKNILYLYDWELSGYRICEEIMKVLDASEFTTKDEEQ